MSQIVTITNFVITLNVNIKKVVCTHWNHLTEVIGDSSEYQQNIFQWGEIRKMIISIPPLSRAIHYDM